MPPPVLEVLNSTRLEAAKRAAILTTVVPPHFCDCATTCALPRLHWGIRRVELVQGSLSIKATGSS
ncbi:hypothetical protein BGW80DRAFT_1354165 [Lactifluus volemus]|nr:hypothetical protein BGW80DRAFT_1354165 [Lactifluus volemus]